ncbi:hypothetical protein UPYG_G00306720 [Umbra pygmaea]|uniref:Cortactin-binding protein-2 N-terminal domain-containing protein n=1 Tax=Umbra pygmaea TaxID=75934 RepID=A0ABD0W0K0_UMBPY
MAHLHPFQNAAMRGIRQERKEKSGRELSRADLVFLLSIMEGEMQARDEVIAVLKAEKMDLVLLEAQYGICNPGMVLRALQRDSFRVQCFEAPDTQNRHIYEEPMAKLEQLMETGQQSYSRMLEQLEHTHNGALCRLEEQERQHRAFIQRSDNLTALLEHDRERSVT